MKKVDRIGERFGRLTIVEEKEPKLYKPRTYARIFLCKCDCGNMVVASYTNLKAGNVRSCGCLKKDCGKGILSNESQNQDKLRLHMSWRSMKNRCSANSGRYYKNYKLRGISVCEEWKKDFNAFYEWAINNGYYPTLSIDRIDGTKGYSPDNCRWATAKMQANNIKTNVIITYNGESHTIPEWSQITNIPSYVIRNRRNYGWNVERILTTPVIKKTKTSK
jgi:hypothetical protein